MFDPDTTEKVIIPIAGILASIVLSYWTTKQVIAAQFKNGKVLLLEIVKRYTINLQNSFDSAKKIKVSDIDKEYYFRELEAINSELEELFANPLLIKLHKENSELTMLAINLRREIVTLKQPDSKLAINIGTLGSFIMLFDSLKREYKNKKIWRDPKMVAMIEFINYLRTRT